MMQGMYKRLSDVASALSLGRTTVMLAALTGGTGYWAGGGCAEKRPEVTNYIYQSGELQTQIDRRIAANPKLAQSLDEDTLYALKTFERDPSNFLEHAFSRDQNLPKTEHVLERLLGKGTLGALIRCAIEEGIAKKNSHLIYDVQTKSLQDYLGAEELTIII